MSFFGFKKKSTESPSRYLTPAAPACIYTITTTFSGDQPHTLRYNVEIQRMQHQKEPGIYLLFNRTDVLINNNPATDWLAADLAAQCGSVIYPLQLEQSVEGHFLQIANHKEICDRWNARKGKIQRYFSGNYAQEYIEHTGYTLQDPIRLLNILKQELFLSTYCSSLIPAVRKQITVQYPVIPFSPPLPFLMQQERSIVAGEVQHTQRTGTLLPDTTAQRSGSASVRIALNKTGNYIRQLDAQWDVQDAGQSYKVTLQAICIADNTSPRGIFLST